MIRRGKTEGWLQLPHSAFLPWAALNGVTFDRSLPGQVSGRGGALLAREDLDAGTDDSRVLLSVPGELILSLDRVKEHAKVDRDFREVFERLGEFGSTPRGAILSFLLVQSSISCPDLRSHIGVHGPFTDYVKTLPMEPLPTFWTPAELGLLVGTTLAPALSAKSRSLRREYDLLCSLTEGTRWYEAVQDFLDFDDWLQVDAMYRSRALDFPNIGHCMVPCIDIANHATEEATIAVYEKDADGKAVLLLRDGKQLPEGGEVTITYGDEKGACEMLFSYGFLDEDMGSAKTLFLSLSIPDSDKFQIGKARVAGCAPGFQLSDTGDETADWTGEFIWLLCVNEEDGLRFELARTVDNRDEEMQAVFQDRLVTGGAAQLHDLLRESTLWDVYQLRAIAILQQRTFDQLQVLYRAQDEVEAVARGISTDIRSTMYQLAMKLRKLEFGSLERAYESFEDKKNELIVSPVVTRFLAEMNAEPHTDEMEPDSERSSEDVDDFS